jgi:exo-beta-1,3-glucanase (GH17 family)
MAGEAPRRLPPLQPDQAICYSGYREGQSPDLAVYPSYQQVREDLLLLRRHWRVLRMYDAGPHAELTLEVIHRERLPLTVMLGASLAAEADNPGCPWGGVYGAEVLARNATANEGEVRRLITLARRHPELVVAVSAGNEATVDWTDHLVPPERVLEYARQLRRDLPQPVTFCENYVPWQEKLSALAAELDFLSVHTYPVWEFKGLAEALAYTEANWRSVADRYPGKPVVITEAGWTTASSGRGIKPENATPAIQAKYLQALGRWCRERGVLTFVFEAFDEPWKGSPDPLEPEKHWGLFTAERRPKPAVQRLYPELSSSGGSP